MAVRGIRGATTANADDKNSIIQATSELLLQMQSQNRVNIEDIASIFFTVSPDLQSAFPAQAARELGWAMVPLLCAVEIGVPGSLKRCIRVLMLVNTDKSQSEIKHVYLRQAISLRPDWAGNQ